MLKKYIAYHSEPLRLDLQFFSDDDVILPDDFQPETVETTETTETPVDTGFDTPETELTEEPSQESKEQQIEEQRQAFLKVKYNKEEMDLDEDTARELAQKGLNYDKMQERLQALETDPRLSFVEGLAKEQGMDVNQFLDAVKQAREQDQIDELMQKNIPEEYAKEMLENRRLREQYEADQQKKADQEKQEADFHEFHNYFRDANGREFDPTKDTIPKEVWEATDKGIPLRFAYMEHEAKQLRSKVQVLTQNDKNKQRAPISSLSAHGSTEVASEDPFLMGFNSIK